MALSSVLTFDSLSLYLPTLFKTLKKNMLMVNFELWNSEVH